MAETFIFKQNKQTFQFSVDLEDVELSWQKGKTIPNVRLKKCTLPAGSIMTSNHGIGLSEMANNRRDIILPAPSEEAPKIGNRRDWAYHTLTTDTPLSEKSNLSLGHILGVLTGASLDGPHLIKFSSSEDEKNGCRAYDYFAIMHINNTSSFEIKTMDEYNAVVARYETEKSHGEAFADWLQKQSGQATRSSTPGTPGKFTKELVDVLEWKKNVILEGVPGVGKTFCIDQLKENLGIENGDGRFVSITFSPSMGTEEFIGGLFPKPGTSPPVFSFEKGPLIKLAETAALSSSKTKHLLFIDEINRGNIPKIMGEIMTVIEGTKRFSVDDSNTVLAERQDGDVFRASMFLSGEQMRYFGLPDNLYIVGAMNTSDRSVVQIDSALRRRFAFIRVDTMLVRESSDKLKQALRTSEQASKFWSSDERMDAAEDVLQSLFDLNKTLREQVGMDAMLGHSYLFDLRCCPQQASDAEGNEIDENEDCFWKAIRDMLLLSVYPQLADTAVANGVGDDNIAEINDNIEKLNSILNVHLSDVDRLHCKLIKPSSTFGQYRLE